MMRRRVNALGRAALQSAYWVAPPPALDTPLVFASRWGDIERTVSLLDQLASGAGISPTGFSTSVHNAIAALFSIARADSASYSAVAGGHASAEAGVIEALGLLADGARSVTLVVYEDALPGPLAGFAGAIEFPHAWACSLVATTGPGFSLASRATAEPTQTASSLPPDLQALAFLVGTEASWSRDDGARTWHWQRHA